VNGVRMAPADITATSGSSVVFADALASGDIVDIITYTAFDVVTNNASDLSSGTVPSARVAGAYTGITSVGTLTGTTISTADNTDQLILKSTDADANVGPVLRLNRDSGSPADNDLIGSIIFQADDDGGNTTNLVEIITQIEDASDGNESADLFLKTRRLGSLVSRIGMYNSTTAINDDGADIDFRIESDNDANAFFVEGSTGHVGIGTSSPGQLLEINGASNPAVLIKDTTNNCITYMFSQDSVATFGSASAHPVVFNVSNGEKARIDTNGNVMFGSSSQLNSGKISVLFNGASQNGLIMKNTHSGGNHLEFINSSGNAIGTINQNSGSSVAYNTSSDYRLKENVITDWDATTRLKQLKPSRFNFITDADTTVDGFLAHEVSSIVPEAISGTKDATETYTDDDGKEQTRPKYQGIDQSKLVPLLVKSLQEALTEIDTLKTKVAALESA